MTCPNKPTHVLIGIDAEEFDLPQKYSCQEHLANVLDWFCTDNGVTGAWLERMTAEFLDAYFLSNKDASMICHFITPEEVASVLESKKKITAELERRIAKGEL